MFRSAQHDRKRNTPFRFNASTIQRLNDPHIVPDSHCAQAHVEIGETDPEQAQPGPQHVTLIKARHASVRAIASWRLGKLIQKAAGQMPQ